MNRSAAHPIPGVPHFSVSLFIKKHLTLPPCYSMRIKVYKLLTEYNFFRKSVPQTLHTDWVPVRPDTNGFT